MKPYKEIKCVGHTFKMLYPCNSITKKGLVGEITYSTNTMRIAEKVDGHKRTRTEIEASIMHEIVHMVDRYYNNDCLTEKQVVILAQGFYQVLKDNFNLKLLKKGR